MSIQAPNHVCFLEKNAQSQRRESGLLAHLQHNLNASSENRSGKFGLHKLVSGSLIFIGLTIAIFWYQFSEISGGSKQLIWNQLKWGYLFWLLVFLPIDTFAAGLRIWVICRVLQPGVNLWTCLKSEWANLGLAMLTPSQTGGGFGQIYVLNRGGVNLAKALSVSLISFLGSMVVLLFIGLYCLFLSDADRLDFIFQGAFLIFLLVFSVPILAVCWPRSLRFGVVWISRAMRKIGGQCRPPDNIDLPQNTRIKRLMNFLHNYSEKLIELCYMHQVNIRRFFNLKRSSFVWVCLLSLAFMLSRSLMAFLCLRFLGIQSSSLFNVIETQLSLIFLIYFAPTPGSSGLAEGASTLMMGGDMPIGLVPYYNLLWRFSTLYLPAIAGLLFLLWTIMQDTRKVIGR
jgi:uncharacterized protein (TIRG00374 family)